MFDDVSDGFQVFPVDFDAWDLCPLLNTSALQLRRLQAPDPPALALDVRMNHEDRWLVHGGLLAEMGNCNHNGGIKPTIMGHLMG